MITDIKVQDKKGYGWPPYEVVLDGEELLYLTDSNSPTGRGGCTRYVFMSDKYMVKVGRIGEAYLEILPQDKEFFAEVVLVDINRKWLIQRRVSCLHVDEINVLDWEVVAEVAQNYNVGDVCYRWDEGERTPHNWTVQSNGQQVIFDYDQNSECGEGFGSWQLRSHDTGDYSDEYED